MDVPKRPDEGLDSYHHMLAVVMTTILGEGLVWTKIEPDFGFLIF